MLYLRNKTILTKKATLVTSVCLLVVVAIGVAAYIAFLQPKANQANDSPRPINSVDYGGPTQEERTTGDSQKEKNEEREQLDSRPTTSTANIVITDANQYGTVIEARAFISNIYEDGGICIATYTKPGAGPVIVQSKAFRDAKTIQCGAMDVGRDKFATSGEWSVVVDYNSPTASGKSSPQKVIIK